MKLAGNTGRSLWIHASKPALKFCNFLAGCLPVQAHHRLFLAPSLLVPVPFWIICFVRPTEVTASEQNRTVRPAAQGAEMPAHKVDLGSWLGERICRLCQRRSSRALATGAKFDPPIGRGRLGEVEIGRLTWPGRHISTGL